MKHDGPDESITELSNDDPDLPFQTTPFAAEEEREAAQRQFNAKLWLGENSPLALAEIIDLEAVSDLKEVIAIAPRMVAFVDRPPMNGLTLGDAMELALRFIRRRRQRGRPPKEDRNPFIGDFVNFHAYWRTFGESFSKKEIPPHRVFLISHFDEVPHVPKLRVCRNCHKTFDTHWPKQTECSLRCAEQMLGISHTEENRAAWLLATKARAIVERRKCEPAPDSLAPVSRIVVWRAAELHA